MTSGLGVGVKGALCRSRPPWDVDPVGLTNAVMDPRQTNKQYVCFFLDFARDKHLGALNSRTSLNELGSIYQSWADRYDEDCRAIGYVGPKVGAECLAEWVTDSKARILDVGAGTGMGGVELKRLGNVLTS